MKNISPLLTGPLLALTIGFGASTALAQEAPPPAATLPDEANCGTWTNGQWIPNGSCASTDYRSRVAGTITSVKGHLVTLQQTAQSLVINDKPALDRQASGRVAVGRVVTAYGYWSNGTFYATRIV